MKSICKYCTFCKPLTETSAECCFKPFEHRPIKPTKASCIQYRPRTILEADTRIVVIFYVRQCLGSQTGSPSDCNDFIRSHIQDPGVQAAIPILIRDLSWHIDSEENTTCLYKDPHLHLWKDLLAFVKDNQKGDKA